MGQDIFRLELPQVNIDRDSPKNAAVFEFRNYQLTQELRTGLIVGDSTGDISQTVQQAVQNAAKKQVTNYGVFTANAGTGQRIFTLSFKVAAGDTADSVTWGDPSVTPTPNAANATGESAFFRMQVLERYLATVTEDSVNPAKISFGEYINGGEFADGDLEEDGIECVVENPTFTYDPEERPSEFTGEITFVETLDASTVQSSLSALNRDGV